MFIYISCGASVRKAESANETHDDIVYTDLTDLTDLTDIQLSSSNAHTFNAHSRRKPKNEWLHFNAIAELL